VVETTEETVTVEIGSHVVIEEPMEIGNIEISEPLELTQIERASIAHNAVRNVLNSLYHQSDNEKDLVIISAEGVSHRCHSSLLALTSDLVRSSLVGSERNEADSSYVIQLPDIPSYQVDAFLMMLYCTTSHDEGSSWSSTTEMQELVNLLQADFYHPEPEELLIPSEMTNNAGTIQAKSKSKTKPCPGEVIEFSNEKELSMRGCNFLRRHGGQHKIPFARTMKVAQLVPAIIQHYKEVHRAEHYNERKRRPFHYSLDARGNCPGKVLDIKSESELEKFGNSFLRSHAVRHGIPGGRCGRNGELAVSIMEHYRQAHKTSGKVGSATTGAGKCLTDKVCCKHCSQQIGVLVMDVTVEQVCTSYHTCDGCGKSSYVPNKVGYRLAVFTKDISMHDPLSNEASSLSGPWSSAGLGVENKVYATKREEIAAKKAVQWKKWYGKVGGVRVKCPKCVVYVVRPKANEHEINHHSPGLPEKCPHCDYATLTKTGIKTHISKWHSQEVRTIECSYGCGKMFANKHLLNYHTRQSCKLSPEAAHYKAERNATRNAKTKKAFMQKKRENERLEMYNQLGIKPIKEDVSMLNSINVPI